MSESTLLKNYKVEKFLGVGGFGAVLQCRHGIDGQRYAIKLVKMDSSTPDDSILKEVGNMVKASEAKHLNVVQYYTCWKDRIDRREIDALKGILKGDPKATAYFGPYMHIDVVCVQMELCGQDLRGWLNQQATVDADTAIGVFIQLVNGIAHIHSLDLIHRDLKPENCLFSANGDLVKIADLGMATPHETQLSKAFHTPKAGTPLYLAPEQSGTLYGKAVDIFALGLIFFEILHPQIQEAFHQGDWAPLLNALTALRNHGELPQEMQTKWPKASQLILKMVSMNPKDRPGIADIYSTFMTTSNSSSTSKVTSQMKTLSVSTKQVVTPPKPKPPLAPTPSSQNQPSTPRPPTGFISTTDFGYNTDDSSSGDEPEEGTKKNGTNCSLCNAFVTTWYHCGDCQRDCNICKKCFETEEGREHAFQCYFFKIKVLVP